MKKLFKMLAITAFVLCVALMSVSAFKVEYYLDEIDADEGQYDLVVNLQGDPGGNIVTFTTKFTFNNEKMILTDDEYEPVDLSTVVEEPLMYPTIWNAKRTKILYQYASVDHSWTTNGNKTQAFITIYAIPDDAAQFDQDDLDMIRCTFVLADGVTPEDILANDFTVDLLYIADQGAGCSYAYNDSRADFEISPASIVNNVAAAAPVTTIPVTAGDIIYLADGTTDVAETTGDYDVDTTVSGIIVVNTGYTAQKVYEVASGAVSERTDLENAVLGSSHVSIRGNGGFITDAAGIRFLGDFNQALLTNTDVVEYGFMGTADSDSNGLSAGYVLNSALVDSGKAVGKPVYTGSGDGTYAYNENNRRIVTVVFYGMPITADNVLTNVTVRPYVKLSGNAYIYGEPYTRTAYSVAYDMTGETEPYSFDTDAQDYIDEILNAYDTEPIVDVGPLLNP